ncbi:hypothetical protein RD792_004893 [Penstemon davidsonii]|uniref:Elongation factor Ts, mitochondrial n=1 Tax=Penstemon davidsonii TaxID=160366 RepID=A0ABR0DIP3_9LAMI|nr:hypothetical protein RD792_004893 [Penstemon davidsonii]
MRKLIVQLSEAVVHMPNLVVCCQSNRPGPVAKTTGPNACCCTNGLLHQQQPGWPAATVGWLRPPTGKLHPTPFYYLTALDSDGGGGGGFRQWRQHGGSGGTAVVVVVGKDSVPDFQSKLYFTLLTSSTDCPRAKPKSSPSSIQNPTSPPHHLPPSRLHHLSLGPDCYKISCWITAEAAQKDLRKRGVVLASKKSFRTAAEGLLALAQDEKKAVVVELNCETDFVARNDIFQYLASSLAKSALLLEGSMHPSIATPVGPECLEDLKLSSDHPKLTGEKSVQIAITEVAAMMGENVKLGGGFVISAPSHGVLATYLHTSPQPGIGRIAGILSLEVEDKDAPLDAVKRVGSEIAMHVVAAKPLFLTKEDVSSDALDNEREILRSQAESTGKSQMAIDKMVEGRLRKYYEEVVLMEQKFVVDDSLNIKTLLNNLSKEVGSNVKIGYFLRVEVGEGLKR